MSMPITNEQSASGSTILIFFSTLEYNAVNNENGKVDYESISAPRLSFSELKIVIIRIR